MSVSAKISTKRSKMLLGIFPVSFDYNFVAVQARVKGTQFLMPSVPDTNHLCMDNENHRRRVELSILIL